MGYGARFGLSGSADGLRGCAMLVVMVALLLTFSRNASAVNGPASQEFTMTRVGSTSDAALSFVAEYPPADSGEAISSVAMSGPAVHDYTIAQDTCTGTSVPASCSIRVRFAPESAGLRTALLRLTGAAGAVDVELRGFAFIVGPVLTPSAATTDFGPVAFGRLSAPRSLVLTNTGDSPATVGTVALEGSQDYLRTGDDCSRTSVEVGAACAIELRFHPLQVGPQSAVLRVPWDAPSPILVGLSGATPPPPPPASPSFTPSSGPREWSEFGVLRAVPKRQRLTVKYYTSLPARVRLVVWRGRKRVATVRQRARASFNTARMRGHFPRGAYRIHLTGESIGRSVMRRGAWFALRVRR